VTGRRCGLLAEDCAADHWAATLTGSREHTGQWRANCPLCEVRRALAWDLHGQAIRWNNFCKCDRDTLRAELARLLPACMSRRRADRHPVNPDDVEALALSDMPATALRLALLELAGWGTQEALAKLGVHRANHARTIAERTAGASKRMQIRRSAPHQK
jgi:hypothetical protein